MKTTLSILASAITLTSALPVVVRDDGNHFVGTTVVSKVTQDVGFSVCNRWGLQVDDAASTYAPVCRGWDQNATSKDSILELRTVKLVDTGDLTCSAWHVEAHDGIVSPVCAELAKKEPSPTLPHLTVPVAERDLRAPVESVAKAVMQNEHAQDGLSRASEAINEHPKVVAEATKDAAPLTPLATKALATEQGVEVAEVVKNVVIPISALDPVGPVHNQPRDVDGAPDFRHVYPHVVCQAMPCSPNCIGKVPGVVCGQNVEHVGGNQ